MRFLLYDVESTSLINDYKAKSSDWEKFPRIVQIAFAIYDDQMDRKIDIGTRNIHGYIIKPEGWDIPQDATDIHGITTERAMDEGVDARFAMGAFWALQGEVDFFVAHNSSFDSKLIRADSARIGGPNRITKIPTICTMHSTTKWCNLPGKRGPKWPKLTELFEKCFNEPMANAHDAVGDVLGMMDCFKYLRQNDVISQATLEAAVDRHLKIEKAVKDKAAREAGQESSVSAEEF